MHPDKTTKVYRILNRFLINVINLIEPMYVDNLVMEAMRKRNIDESNGKTKKSLQIDADLAKALFAYPMVNRK